MNDIKGKLRKKLGSNKGPTKNLRGPWPAQAPCRIATARRLKSRHPFVPTAQQIISLSDNSNICAAHWADHPWNVEWADNLTRLRTFVPITTTCLRNESPKNSLGLVRLNHLSTGVGRFRFCLYKWGVASSAACEYGAEEQTVDHEYPSVQSNDLSWTSRPDGSGR